MSNIESIVFYMMRFFYPVSMFNGILENMKLRENLQSDSHDNSDLNEIFSTIYTQIQVSE